VTVRGKPRDVNMLPSEGQDDPQAGEREYALAKAYTQARPTRPVRPRRTKLLIWLGLVLAPMVYAVITPGLSDGLIDGWFQAWARETAGLTDLVSVLLPGLAIGSAAIYGGDPQALADVLNFASIDMLCVFATCLLIFGFSTSLRWAPKAGSLQFLYLHYMVKGFPYGRPRNPRRVGGAAGGLAVAFLHVLGIAIVLAAFFVVPAFFTGNFFRDAHYYCALSHGVGRHSECIRYAAYTLYPTLWKLGWMSSLAAALVPLGVWLGLVGLYYPVWLLLGRPTRP